MSPFSANNFRLPGNRKARARRARLAGRAGITLSVVLVATLLPVQAWAAPPGDRSGVELPGLQKDVKVKPDQAAMDALGHWVGDPPKPLEDYTPTAVAPPAEASATIPLAPVPTADFVQVGSLPVSIGKVPGTGAAPTGTWSAAVEGRAKTEAAGVDGAIIKITPPVDAVNPVDVALDYSKFQDLYGTEWSSRLKLRQYPACFLDHPELPECSVSVDVPSSNDAGGKKVIATLDPAATPVQGMQTMSAGGAAGAMAVVASDGAAGAGGSYKATSLSPSGTWTAGGSGGGFSWTYPLTVPPAPAGPTPSIAFSYSSQAVDGRTSVTNGQASWVGDGWDYNPGFVERRYRSCSDDLKASSSGKPNNDNTADKKKGDLCWAGDSVVLSLNGSTTELVHDAASGAWVPATDDGSKVELKTGSGNGAKDSEYWVVTTRDGMRYHYGRHSVGTHGDGTSPKTVTDSVFTVPVFGNHPGEPCYQAAYANSSCMQAWRWNLDYVEDVHGNAMVIDWAKEENRYAKNEKVNEKDRAKVGYIRGGYPTRILYGLRADNLAGAPAGRVEFGVEQRCFEEKNVSCAESLFGSKNGIGWYDTPASLNCKMDAAVCESFSPTFWSRMRLDRVTTYGQRTEGSTALTKVDQWALKQSLPKHRTDTSPPLWLESITRTAYGAKNSTIGVSLPPVSFKANAVDMPNRVLKADTNGKPDAAPDFDRLRVGTILTETGGEIEVKYSAPCAKGTSVPDLAKNTTRCFPVHWSADSGLDPDKVPPIELFNKYVVDSVVEKDRVAQRPDVKTSYTYEDAAWAKEDDEFTKPDRRTYSQWRGYASVVTTTGKTENAGKADATEQGQTRTRYFRGLSTDTAKVTVKDSSGTEDLGEDLPQYQGRVAETVEYSKAGGSVESRELTWPRSMETARRKRTDTSDLVAYQTGVARTDAIESVSGGKSRVARTLSIYEGKEAYGLLKSTQTDVLENRGTGWTTVKQSCTKPKYVHNTASNLIGLPSEVIETAGDCAGGGVEAGTRLSATRTSYDAVNAFGAAPTRGLPYQVDTTDAAGTGWTTSGRTEYDVLGRAIKTYDAAGNPSSVAFSPPTGPAFSTTTTNALGHAVTTKVDPARGSLLEATDANGRKVTTVYDELGRSTEVRTPSQKSTDPAAYTYEYQIAELKTPAVISRTLKDNGTYSTSIAIYDGQLRPRQSQTEGPGGARLITDTLHSANGTVSQTNNGYLAEGKVSTELYVPKSVTEVPSSTQTAYDGLGRAVRVTTLEKGEARQSAVTQYGGDWTLTRSGMSPTGSSPLRGSRAAKTWTDALGRTSEIEHYTATDLSTSTRTGYTYDVRSKLVKVTDTAGNNWTYTHDARGRMTSSEDPDTGKSTFTYNNLDQQVSSTNVYNVTQYTSYDVLGRRTALRDDSETADPIATWTYDTLPGGKGQPVASTRKWGASSYKTEVTGYDSEYRPTGSRITIPDLPSTKGLAGSYAYSTTYTPTGKVQSTTLPATIGGLAAEKLITRYNADGMVQTMSGLSWYTAETVYSPYGEILRTASGNAPNRVWTTNTFDPHTGRVASATSHKETRDSASGSNLLSSLSYTYDAVGNPTAIKDTYPGTTPQSQPLVDRQCYSYDATGQLVRAWTGKTEGCPTGPTGPERTEVGSGTTGDAYWQDYQFDAIGNRTKLTDRDPTDSALDDETTYSYGVEITGGALPHPKKQPHALTKVNKTTRTAGSTVDSLSTYTYSAAGSTKTRTIDGDTQTLNWDRRNKLLSATSPGIGSVVVTGLSGKCLDVQDGNTADGTPVQLLSCNETKPQQWRITGDTVQALGKCLTSENGKAVLKACKPGEPSQKFTYRETDKALITGTNQCLTVPNDNDAEGNDLHTFTCASPAATPAQQWSFGNVTSYLYDTSGNRVIQDTGNARTLYLGETEITVDKAGKAIDAVRYYSSPGAPTTVRRTNGKTTGHTLSHLLTDHHNTATISVEQKAGQPTARRKSDPYGNPRGNQPTSWPGDRTFLGTGNDDNTTGLIHIGAREYEAGTGRFITVDPVIDITDPLQMNGYTYSNGNPVTNLDPDGLKYFEGDSDGGFQAEASKVVEVAQRRITQRAARDTAWNQANRVVKKKKPSTWTNIWTGVVRGWASADQVAPHGPILSLLGISGRDQANWLFKKFGVESDENAWESIIAEVLAPMPPAAKAAAGPGLVRKSAAAVSRLFKNPPCNSFVAGTKVLLANGGSKPIEQLAIGDEVRAADPESGETGAKTVTATIYTADDKKYTDLTVQTGDGAKTITTTDHHPFWSESDHVWKDAGDLKPGENLRTEDGESVAVSAIRTYEAFNETYNLTVADLHTYYVIAGATPVLVHNCNVGSFTAGGRQWVHSYDGSLKKQGISATEEDGLIEAVVRAPKNVVGLPSGTQMLEGAIAAFNRAGREITGIRASWNSTAGLTGNLDSLNKAILEGGMTPNAAVWETFTGKFAQRKGFTNAWIDEGNSAPMPGGGYREIMVHFTRPKG
ncbi:polymorphic toxin-type HINT domain-containing protein [Streptomyces virginiae]|uniref:polymorphic toxin-type HINT domain-containing protein n=1 Tax=Streptomyces virginiae TaxID=1961 RepID=UPI0022515B48|nr:polymorphic toxin-type HINT domain-containing protein [Streptomyces virginiae]MCX5274647.1 polymorphic toxin-type HINT domain-containing protein [Streptomyces virginiae]